MGCGSSSPVDRAAEARNRAIEAANRRDFMQDQQRIKLLLLGAGESGKSTFFKQMRILNMSGFSREEREAIRPNIHTSIIDAFQTVLENASALGHEVRDTSASKAVMSAGKDQPLTPDLAKYMSRLWQDPGVVTAWKERSGYQVTDSLAWFIQHLDRVSKRDYVPDDQDMLHVRVRTSGIIEEKFKINDVEFSVFDVGGQRNERKKWIHCFDDVTAVMFFAALSEYDQVLYEDSTTKRMDEAVTLFDEICNSKFFVKTAMMLFLNKNDLFREKLTQVPFRVDAPGPKGRFQDYRGPVLRPGTQDGTEEFARAYAATLDYLQRLFVQRNRNPKKQVYVHTTCATDTKNVNKVFDSCKDIILNQNLVQHGFA